MSRRALAADFSVGLSGEGFTPFRGAAPFGSFGLLGGGAEGPEGTGDAGVADGGGELGAPESSEGSTETAINVSKSRAFMTFSRPVCEWSGKLVVNGAVDEVIVDPGRTADDWIDELREDVIEVVRGLCPLIVGAWLPPKRAAGLPEP